MTRDSFLRQMARVGLEKGRLGYAARAWERLNERLAKRATDNERRRARRAKGQQMVESILTDMEIERILGAGYVAAVLWW